MDPFEKNLLEMIEAFTELTGVGVFSVDPQSFSLLSHTAKYTPEELSMLDVDECRNHLHQLSKAETASDNYFDTFFSSHQIVYNIIILKKGTAIYSYLVTEPMLISPPGLADIQEICRQRGYSVEDRMNLSNLLLKVQVSSWKRVHQIGIILNLLCISIPNVTTVRHAVLDLGKAGPDSNPVENQIESALLNAVQMDPAEIPMYHTIKSIIQSGDTHALAEFVKTLNIGDIPLRHLMNMDFLRVVKDYFIIFCSIEMFFAVEAGMRYPEMMTLTVKMVNEAEQMKQVSDVFSHMKLSLSTFTNAVNVFNKQRHSKTIHLFLSYIHEHYAEKITLQTAAVHIGLNPSYLSSLIHKETGISFSDHVNRIRIESSKQELMNTSRSINEIAESVGFSYQNHYARVFRKYTGLTPLEYRERKSGMPKKNINRKPILPNA